MTPATLHYDARITATTNSLVQRYSDERDSWIVLSVEGSEYVLHDQRSGATSRLCREATNEARLAAHWAGFCETHKVSR